MKKNGSALVIMLVIIGFLTAISTVVVQSTTNTTVTTIKLDIIKNVQSSMESGLQAGIAQLDLDNTNRIAIPTIKTYDNKIKTDVTFGAPYTDADGNTGATITSTASTLDGQHTKTGTWFYPIETTTPPSVEITSSKFSLKRKLMTSNITVAAGSHIDFKVKNGYGNLPGDDEKPLFLNNNNKSVVLDNGFVSIDGNGNGNGTKQTSNSFFMYTTNPYTIPAIVNNSSEHPYNIWLLNSNKSIYYYLTDSLTDITKRNTVFMDNSNNKLKKTRVVFVKGDINLTGVDYSYAKSYLNNLVIYCTGNIIFNNTTIGTGSNGNGNSDLTLCLISNGISVSGNSFISYVWENSSFSGGNDNIDTIIKQNIVSSIDWN